MSLLCAVGVRLGYWALVLLSETLDDETATTKKNATKGKHEMWLSSCNNNAKEEDDEDEDGYDDDGDDIKNCNKTRFAAMD